MNRQEVILMAMAAGLGGCTAVQPQPAPSQLVLPEGDVEAGKRAFVSVGCASCHRVQGVDGLPEPQADPPVPIVFGRPQASRPTTERLVTAIVNPSHHISEAHKGSQVRLGDGSRMADFTRALTVRELVDIVAFLQSTHDGPNL